LQGGSALLLLRVFFIFKLQQDLTGHDGSREEEIVREITDSDEDNDDAWSTRANAGSSSGAAARDTARSPSGQRQIRIRIQDTHARVDFYYLSNWTICNCG